VKQWFVSFALIVLSAAMLHAQQPAAPAAKNEPSAALPTVDQVLARYVRALGGQAALSKLHSRVMIGTFEIPSRQISGSAELDMQAPDHFYSRVSIPGGGDHILVFDGKSGWALDPQSGLREVTGLELTELRRSSQFLYESRLRALFAAVRVLEKAMEGDRPVWVLEAIPAQGPAERFYFDTQTGLLLRHDSTQSTPDGDVPIEHRYFHYIAVDGVQVPSLLRHHDPSLDWQVTFSEIRQNVSIDPAEFARPAAPTTAP